MSSKYLSLKILSNNISSLLFFALTISFLSVIFFQGSRGLYETTEGRYALCARETMLSGNLLEPVLHGKHHWTKPPLTYIVIASGLFIFGDNSTWGARFYLIPAFILTVIFVYLFAKALWDPSTGVISALIYSCSPFLVGAANSISTDTLLVLWHSLTFFAFWKAYQTKNRWFIYLFWLGVGLGCITKGPMGFIPLMGILPFCLWRWLVYKEKLWYFISPIGIFIFFIVGIAWYFWENMKYPGLLQYWLFHETVGRLAEGEFDRNPEWYKVFPMYFLPVIFGTGFWLFLLLYALHRNKKDNGKYLSFSFSEHQWFLLIASFVFPFVFFLISKSRLTLYILPVFIPLTIMIGRILQNAVEYNFISVKKLVIVAIINSVLIISAKGFSAYYPNGKDMKQLANDIQPLLGQFHQPELYCIKSNDLNGFEFYTYIPVPEKELPEEQGLAPETALENIMKTITDFLTEKTDTQRIILIPRKYEKVMKNLKIPDKLKIHPVNKFWVAMYYSE